MISKKTTKNKLFKKAKEKKKVKKEKKARIIPILFIPKRLMKMKVKTEKRNQKLRFKHKIWKDFAINLVIRLNF